MEILKDPDLYPVEFVLLNIKRYDVYLVVSSHKVCFKLKSIKQGLERPNLNNKFPKTEIRQRYRTDKIRPGFFVYSNHSDSFDCYLCCSINDYT